MNTSKKAFLFSFIGLITIASLSACNLRPAKLSGITIPPAAQVTSKQWQTFSIAGTAGFSFQYPADWKTNSQNTVKSPDWKHLETGAEFFFQIDPAGSDFQYLNVNAGSAKTTVGDLTIVFDQLTNAEGNIEARIYDFERNGHKYWFKFENSRKNPSKLSEYYEIEDHLLKSLKFNQALISSSQVIPTEDAFGIPAGQEDSVIAAQAEKMKQVIQ